MKKINDFLYNKSFKILIIFLFLQPIIDMLTAISLKVFHNSFVIGLIIRFVFIIYLMYYTVFLSKNRNRNYINYLLIIVVYILLFGINIIYSKGFSSLFYEFKYTFKSFYFPITLVSLIGIFKDNEETFDINIFSKIFIIYSLGVLIPNILGIGFSSYEVTKGGNIGFFYTANEIGAILSVLIVFYIDKLYRNKKYIGLFISILIGLYILTSIGTKGPLILFIILILYYLFKYLKSLFKEKKYILLSEISVGFIVLLGAFIILLPKTNFYKNIVVHMNYWKINSIEDFITNKNGIDHIVFSERLSFMKKTNKIYMRSSVFEKILGIGYISNYSTDDVSMKMVEMDLFDIFYRHGILGFIIYVSSFIVIIYKVIKSKISIDVYGISLLFAFLLAFITGHVLIAPAVSIYVALIINLIYNENSRRVKCKNQN